MRLKLKAFTLVEVLLVASLMAMVGVAIFQSFANGLKLWSRAERLNREAQVAIFFEKMAEDLRSAATISSISFKGMGSQVSFATVVMTKADQRSSRASEGFIDQLGAVEYRFDPGEHTIFRRQANYAQALKGRWQEAAIPVVSGIDELILTYEVSSDKGFFMKSQVSEGIPSGIMVEVHFNDESGGHQIKRYLAIPTLG